MKRLVQRNTRKYRRRAATVIATALLATTLVGIAALGVDVGYIVVTRGNLQNAADAAALASARYLPTASNVTPKAQAYAVQNHPGHGEVVSASDVVLGNWDKDAKAFQSAVAPFNAVRVTVRRSNSGGNSLALFFANILGVADTELSASAVALGPGAKVRFLIDDEMFDTDVPVIQNLASSLGLNSLDLLTDADGDGFIDMPANTVIELPTGQVGDEGIFEVGSEFTFTRGASPSLEDFLRYDVNGNTYGITDSDLDPLPGVEPVSDPNVYQSYVDPDQILVSPLYKSDVSDTQPWVNAKGERRGLVAFKIIAVGADPDGAGSGLPNLIIQIASSAEMAGIDLAALASPGENTKIVLVR